MKVTAEYLETMGACLEDIKAFTKLFPGGFKPTLKNCVLAVESGIEVIWFTENAITSQARRYFNRRDDVAEKKYEEVVDYFGYRSGWHRYFASDLDRDRARALFDTFKHYGAKCLRKRPMG